MSWEAALLDVFEDLEQQAAGLRLADRDAEVADLAAAAYAEVALAARAHASRGALLVVRSVGGLVLTGTLVRSGTDWLLVEAAGASWLVPLAGVVSVSGLSPRADDTESWSAVDRLTLRALVRRTAESDPRCRLHLADGSSTTGAVLRVGSDFLELVAGDPAPGERVPTSTTLVPLAAVAALRGGS
ncbi:hypothetical protein ASG49_16380 [Marmoricola sp. Leaf446]|uniref:hypothetical protein n=1 Tax=Marmoricola sp. Leaf446 TaxID=1736379 RepID=UPI0006FDA4C1|nr:hypothetical protein [Marmoricola sp. Leaf446]KQT89353.1 hypothetical protein ASG49_16380 [Marmoricola sp. Leaf446]